MKALGISSAYFKEHGQGSDSASFPDGIVQTLEVIWIVAVDLHLNESKRNVTR